MNRLTCILVASIALLETGCSAPPPADAPPSPGRQLYEARCGNCHQLFPPHSYADNQWPGVIARMRAQAGLSETEADSILVYLRSAN